MTALSPQGQKPVRFSAGRALPFPKRQVSRPLLERHQAGEVMAGRVFHPHTQHPYQSYSEFRAPDQLHGDDPGPSGLRPDPLPDFPQASAP